MVEAGGERSGWPAGPPEKLDRDVGHECRRSRGTGLVGDDSQSIPLGREPEDGTEKVGPVGRIDPARAKDVVPAASCSDSPFTGEFARSVD